MADYLVRATSEDGNIRALAAVTTEIAEEARRRHDTSPTATAALGRTVTATALLGATLKDEQSITVRIIGDGPIGGIIADGDSSGRVRGYVKVPQADLPLNPQGKLDVGGVVGREGYIYVTRDLGFGQPYTGSAPLVSGEIAEDVTNYLYLSEQVPSATALGVLVGRAGAVQAAGGYLLQLLPQADEETKAELERNLGLLGAVSAAVDAGLTPEDILGRVLKGVPYHILETRPLRFECTCSQERVVGLVASLGADEVRSMLHEDQGAELRCHFCSQVYHLSTQELEQVLERLEHPPA
ncbi:MAG: Hsp33 family molecular chaperone HslO [Bacillota bacterium]